MGLMERLSDPKDPLRFKLEAARKWGIPPTVVLQERTVSTREYTPQDLPYVFALEMFEAGLCPEGHELAETSKPEHEGAYRPDKDREVTCHKCKGAALLGKAQSEDQDSVGVYTPLKLDLDVVALNKQPVPAFPTAEELQQRALDDAERQRAAGL